MWIGVKLKIIGYSTLHSSFFTPNAVAKCSTPLNSWRLIWSAIPIQQMQQTKWTTLFCGARRNRIRSLRWFIHLQFMKCLREINRAGTSSELSPALGLIKSFYRHTRHRTGFTVQMAVHIIEMSDVWRRNTFTDAATTSPHTFCRCICGLSVDNICNASLLISVVLSSTHWPVQDTNRCRRANTAPLL